MDIWTVTLDEDGESKETLSVHSTKEKAEYALKLAKKRFKKDHPRYNPNFNTFDIEHFILDDYDVSDTSGDESDEKDNTYDKKDESVNEDESEDEN